MSSCLVCTYGTNNCNYYPATDVGPDVLQQKQEVEKKRGWARASLIFGIFNT